MRVRERALACGMDASAVYWACSSSLIKPSRSSWPSLHVTEHISMHAHRPHRHSSRA